MKLGPRGSVKPNILAAPFVYIYQYDGQGNCQPLGLRDALLIYMTSFCKTKGRWDLTGQGFQLQMV